MSNNAKGARSGNRAGAGGKSRNTNTNNNSRGGGRRGSSSSGGGNKDANRKPAPDPVLSGALSLVEQIDKLVIVVLRDKKVVRGILRSFDGYANIVLSDAVERLYIDTFWGDIPVDGWFIARAENVVLVGEVSGDADTAGLTRVDADRIRELRKEERARDADKRKVLADVMDEMQILDEY